MMSSREAVIIAPDWPGADGGLKIAIRAELTAYCAFFRRVHLLVFSGEPAKPGWEQEYPRINWHHIPTGKTPLWSRFAKSLGRRDPSITRCYRDQIRPARAALELFFRQADKTVPPAVIFITMPPGVLMPLARKIFPASPIALHSHNVISRAFAGFPREGTILSRAAWFYELARIRRYERRISAAADHFWTISRYDREEYGRLLGVRADGVLGVYLDGERYGNLPPGDPKTIVHVGRIDLRKGRGMNWFVRQVWPIVRDGQPAARLLLGGRSTEQFDDPAAGISGLGFVEAEDEILKQGMIFINPQIDGSGVQLKSIVAMLSGRLLVTTPTGGAGIAGEHPVHFLAEDHPRGLGRIILEAIDDPAAARETARRGQVIARETYNRKTFLLEAHALLAAAFG